MLASGRILGDQVGSTAPVFLALLGVHVLAGLTAVITVAVAALSRKGSPRHIRAGRWYYGAISVVFATATALAVMRWRQDYHLFIIGAVVFMAATTGYQHRRQRRPGDTGHIAGMGVGYVAMLTAFYVDNGPHLPLWDRLPPIVPRLRTIGSPMSAAASGRSGHAAFSSSENSIVRCVVIAPIVIASPSRVMPCSSFTPARSTSVDGLASRSFIVGTSEWPPASSFASGSLARRATASFTLVTR